MNVAWVIAINPNFLCFKLAIAVQMHIKWILQSYVISYSRIYKINLCILVSNVYNTVAYNYYGTVMYVIEKASAAVQLYKNLQYDVKAQGNRTINSLMRTTLSTGCNIGSSKIATTGHKQMAKFIMFDKWSNWSILL